MFVALAVGLLLAWAFGLAGLRSSMWVDDRADRVMKPHTRA
jgi:hypothetical protein